MLLYTEKNAPKLIFAPFSNHNQYPRHPPPLPALSRRDNRFRRPPAFRRASAVGPPLSLRACALSADFGTRLSPENNENQLK